MLILAPGHSVEFGQLLNKLMHMEHGGGKCLAFFVDVFGTVDYFTIQDLIGVDKVSHLATEHSTVRNHLSWHLALQTFDGIYTLKHLLLLGSFHDLWKVFRIFICEP